MLPRILIFRGVHPKNTHGMPESSSRNSTRLGKVFEHSICGGQILEGILRSESKVEDKSRQLLIFYATNWRTWKNRRVAQIKAVKHVLLCSIHTPDKIFQTKKFCSHWATSGSMLFVFSPGIQKSRRLTQTTFPNPVQFLSLMLGRSRSPAVRIVSSTHMLSSVCQRPSIVNSTEHNITCSTSNMLQLFLRTLLWPYPLKRQTLSSTSGARCPRQLECLCLRNAAGKAWHSLWITFHMIQMTSYMGSTRATLRTAVPYHQMRFNTTAYQYFKHGAIICLQRRRIRPIVACVPFQGWQDVSGLYDTLPRLIQNSEFLDIVDIFQHLFCLPDRKAGRDTPSATWRTLSPMKPEKWLGSAKVHSLCPVKFEAQKIFGAFGRPPNGTKLNDKNSTRQLESKWPQPDLPMKA